jgi:hypothetical protein
VHDIKSRQPQDSFEQFICYYAALEISPMLCLCFGNALIRF